jgi:chromate transporter
VALIAVPTFNMAKKAKLNKFSIWIPVVSALLIWLCGVSPILIILAAGFAGFFVGKAKRRKADREKKEGEV